jgi:hypothetical protein
MICRKAIKLTLSESFFFHRGTPEVFFLFQGTPAYENVIVQKT